MDQLKNRIRDDSVPARHIGRHDVVRLLGRNPHDRHEELNGRSVGALCAVATENTEHENMAGTGWGKGSGNHTQWDMGQLTALGALF